VQTPTTARAIATPSAAEHPSPAPAGKSAWASTRTGRFTPHERSSAANARESESSSPVIARIGSPPRTLTRSSLSSPSKTARARAPRSMPTAIAGTP
jgi:hypothetical protein